MGEKAAVTLASSRHSSVPETSKSPVTAQERMDEVEDEDAMIQQEDLDATFIVDRSALRLAQRELSSDSSSFLSHEGEDNIVGWMVEPHKKNLGSAFEQAEATSAIDGATDERKKTNNPVKFPALSKPTPSRATVAVKIARFEAKRAVAKAPATSTSAGSGISVFLRLRPSTDSSHTIQIIAPESGDCPTHIRTIAPELSNAAKFMRGGGSCGLSKEYEFTTVLSETATQRQLYEQTVQPVLPGLVQGESALVFCYGITNAGKTYTVTGPEESLQQQHAPEHGLVPRAVTELVQTCSQADGHQVFLSYFEVYNEQIYDLLAAPQPLGKNRNMLLDTTTTVQAVTRHLLTSVEQSMSLVRTSLKARRSALNCINQSSSRSHAVCKLTVTASLNGAIHNKSADLWIVDLAGSERAKRTGGMRWQEAASINKSLMTLNRCLMALRSSGSSTSQQQQHPPYRESKLTQLFGALWTVNSTARTLMIVNVNPAATDFDETQHVLAYASDAKTINLESATVDGSKPAQYGYNGRRVLQTTVAAELTMKGMAVDKAVEPKPKKAVDKIKAVIRKLSPKRSVLKRKAALPNEHVGELPGASKRARPDTVAESFRPLESNVHAEAVAIDSMQAMRTEYEGTIADLKAQIAGMPNSQCQVDDNVRELFDTIEECEDEMERMREQHVADLARTSQKFESIIYDKNREMRRQDDLVHQLQARLQQLEESKTSVADAASERTVALEMQVKQLRCEIEKILSGKSAELYEKQVCIDKLSKEVNQLQKELVDVSMQAESRKSLMQGEIEKLKSDLESSRAEVQALKDSKEASHTHDIHHFRSNEDNEPKPVERLNARYQIKHQEVVVNIPMKNRVFGSDMTNKPPTAESTASDSSSNDSFGPSRWLKPRRRLVKDPTTGVFLRPRGRAPHEAEAWDEHRGAWRLSQA